MWKPLKRREGWYVQLNQPNVKNIIELAFYRLGDKDGFYDLKKFNSYEETYSKARKVC